MCLLLLCARDKHACDVRLMCIPTNSKCIYRVTVLGNRKRGSGIRILYYHFGRASLLSGVTRYVYRYLRIVGFPRCRRYRQPSRSRIVIIYYSGSPLAEGSSSEFISIAGSSVGFVSVLLHPTRSPMTTNNIDSLFMVTDFYSRLRTESL